MSSTSCATNMDNTPTEIVDEIAGWVEVMSGAEYDLRPTLPGGSLFRSTFASGDESSLNAFQSAMLGMALTSKKLLRSVVRGSRYCKPHTKSPNPESIACAVNLILDGYEDTEDEVTKAVKSKKVTALAFPIGPWSSVPGGAEMITTLRQLREDSHGIETIIFDRCLGGSAREVFASDGHLSELITEANEVIKAHPKIALKVRPGCIGATDFWNLPRTSAWSMPSSCYASCYAFHMPDLSSMQFTSTPDGPNEGINLSLSYDVTGDSTSYAHGNGPKFRAFCENVYSQMSRSSVEPTINVRFFVRPATQESPGRRSLDDQLHSAQQLTVMAGEFERIADELRPEDCKGKLNLSFGEGDEWPYRVIESRAMKVDSEDEGSDTDADW